MNKKLGALMLVMLLAFVGWYAYEQRTHTGSASSAADYKNATYVIDGSPVMLKNGVAETQAAPGSASRITTRYFGNEVYTDLNGDGREDVAFILTQDGAGSGTFYYAVAALNTPEGYVGSDGYLLGDRIAPQVTTVSQNPAQKGVVIFNYADRAPGAPMTDAPSIGHSTYLKLDPASVRWTALPTTGSRSNV